MFKNQMSQDCWSISAPLICRIKNSEHNQNPIKLYFLLNISYFCQAEMKTSFWQFTFLQTILSSLFPGGSVVQNLPAVQEMQAQFLGQEDPLEKRMATHSIILAWRIPWMEEPRGLQSIGSQRKEIYNCFHFSPFNLPWNDGTGSHLLLLFSRWVVSNSATPWTAAHQASLSFTISWNLLKLIPTELLMPLSYYLVLCHPLLLLPSVFPSIWVFSSESVLCIRWPKYWRFSFSISPSNEYSGLISFRMDWLDLLAVHGTLKSLLQHHSSKASTLQCSAFFTVQLSHPYMTTGKTKALTRRTFVGNVMSLLFNMLSRLVIAFLPRSSHLLISWL